MRTVSFGTKLGAVLILGCFLMLSAHAQSPETVTNTVEGISGDIDRHHRAPLISVGLVPQGATSTAASAFKILVAATIPNKTYARYPIRVDYFVNRRLVATQLQSEELPGPLGIDVDSTIAVPPFNYSVVATLLHPNRQFTTVLYGAAFGTTIQGKLDCTLTLSDSAGNDTAFVANDVQPAQSSDAGFSLNFEGKDEAAKEEARAEGTISLTAAASGSTEKTASATLKITRSGTVTEVSVTGTAQFNGGTVSQLELASSDQSTTVSCS